MEFEYKGDPEKTAASRLRGYFTVGDIGFLDSGGFLFLCDRKSDMIISGGANIYPAEIEAEIITSPKVADVAVFGIPDEEWGEQIKAVVQPAAGIEPSDELAAEILASLRGPAGQDEVAEVDRLRRASCRGTRAGSCLSGGCATRTGLAGPPGSDRPRQVLRRSCLLDMPVARANTCLLLEPRAHHQFGDFYVASVKKSPGK